MTTAAPATPSRERSIAKPDFHYSFATHLLEGGYDKLTIQELMGHNDAKTTTMFTIP
jgi:site-specific recombinase XerD